MIKLDPHSESILQEYREHLPLFLETEKQIANTLRKYLSEAGIRIAALESRVKEESSLVGKLELKGTKYKSLADITDILGLRVITFYPDDVDKVASAIERLYEVDWDNSVDKRKLHDLDSFGYLSLHYVCHIPEMPYRMEIQMRTLLQHAWANMSHDTGYKSGVEIPKEYIRNMNRLAGMLELADEQFSLIRMEITDYRRRMQALVASGNLDDASLNGDTFRSYLENRLLKENPFFTPTEKNHIERFIADVPDEDTAVHGDLQYSNAIFVGDRHYFIDLGDFCWGNHLFDVAMVYLCCCLSDEAFIKETFHMPKALAIRFWECFAPAYFGEGIPLKEITEMILPFAGLKTLIVERDSKRPMPEFRAALKSIL